MAVAVCGAASIPGQSPSLHGHLNRNQLDAARRRAQPRRRGDLDRLLRDEFAGGGGQIDALQKEVAALKRTAPKAEKVLASKTEPQGRFWITGKGVKALRKRLGLTQGLFGKLAGVSSPTVVKWEGSHGKAPIRLKAAIARLQAIRKMGKKQATEMLGLVKGKAKRRARKVG